MSRRQKIPLIEFLKDRIYLGAFDSPPQDSPSVVHFTIDDALPYNSFHHDFGPLHIGHLYRFAVTLHEILGEEENEGKAVVLYSRTNPRERANAACVLCCYMVLIQSWPPHLAIAPIAQAEPPFMPFRDAGYAVADFTLSIQDVVYGVWRAKEHKLLDIKSFNLEEYELYERVDQGDFNEIPPHFVAFASPQQSDYESPLPFSFSQVLDYFDSHDVKLVVRLNSHLYNKEEFEARGIKHIDLIFDDGTCPTMLFVKAFIGAVEGVIAQKGKVAVHCKAGLGRTGCLIGAHLIYTYGFTAQECIAYMRFVRPGMVVGPQQHWLYLHQNEFREWRRTMTLSDIPDESLAGYCPLVPVNSPEATARTPVRGSRNTSFNRHQLSPRTPERSILGEVDNPNSALPVPTPGQPRKNSPTPSSRQASLSAFRGDSGVAGMRSASVRNASQPFAASKMATFEDEYVNDENHRFPGMVDGGMNSDDEEDLKGNMGALMVTKSPVRVATDSMSDKHSLPLRQLRSTSNPSPQRRGTRRVPSYQISKVTTTTTTTTTLSSSPPPATATAGLDRRPTRIASGGVRKTSGVRRK